jgi:8-oxo-dGTP pyrophosphatase MutT (NUDIX family)
MPVQPWKILSSKYIHKHVRLDDCELPDGQHIEGTVFEFRDWVTIMALTPQREMVLIRQYRHGAGKVILEMPGGMVDPQDGSPMAAARRELLEETGYASEDFIEVGCVSPNPANHTNRVHSFLALDAAIAGPQRLDPTEEIEVVLTPLDKVITMAKKGELLQSMQVAALFFALAYWNRIV